MRHIVYTCNKSKKVAFYTRQKMHYTGFDFWDDLQHKQLIALYTWVKVCATCRVKSISCMSFTNLLLRGFQITTHQRIDKSRCVHCLLLSAGFAMQQCPLITVISRRRDGNCVKLAQLMQNIIIINQHFCLDLESVELNQTTRWDKIWA